MQHPVVARQVFADVGIDLTGQTYFPEGSLNAALVEKVLQREARWLTFDKSGVLVGYNVDEDIQMGTRVVLNLKGTVDDQDIFWLPFAGDADMSLTKLYAEGLEITSSMLQETRAYIQQGITPRGWAPTFDDAGNLVGLCRNFVIDVSHINRRAA
ncbi:hypothetical protein D3C87_1238620 [compost metagenome]